MAQTGEYWAYSNLICKVNSSPTSYSPCLELISTNFSRNVLILCFLAVTFFPIATLQRGRGSGQNTRRQAGGGEGWKDKGEVLAGPLR